MVKTILAAITATVLLASSAVPSSPQYRIEGLICPVGFCSLWAHSAGFLMQGSLVGRSSSSSSDADVAPLGDDEADELAVLVLR